MKLVVGEGSCGLAAGAGAVYDRLDTLLKENGVVHGCTCLEPGVLLDIFTPMREDFV